MFKAVREAALVAGLVLICLVSAVQAGQDTLVQLSTIDALLSGLYDGETTVGSLNAWGDLGIGTFDALDGEMILLDGTVYRVRADGVAEVVEAAEKTPFAVVTPFEADLSLSLPEGSDLDGFTALADGALPTTNLFYAIRVEGRFKTMRTRSVPRQQKPYPPLVEVVKTQSVFEFEDVEGTIVGFRCPSFVKGVNVPGYHLHFLTADRKAGGHVLGFVADGASAAIDATDEFLLRLPVTAGFSGADLQRDRARELEKVEK